MDEVRESRIEVEVRREKVDLTILMKKDYDTGKGRVKGVFQPKMRRGN